MYTEQDIREARENVIDAQMIYAAARHAHEIGNATLDDVEDAWLELCDADDALNRVLDWPAVRMTDNV